MSFNFLKDKSKSVHFIGIGGISMSGLAAVLLNGGYNVSGSDSQESATTDKLKALGAKIYIGHKEENIKNAGLVVYTAAIREDNPEMIATKKNNIPSMDRAEFLGQIMKGHKHNVAVAGTHGKTSTTSMISHIALNAKLDPTILVGGNLDVIDGNYRIGNSEYFITEACEYKESFLRFFPNVGVILNIDADHLDYYRDINHIQEAFTKFASLIPNDGYLVACADDSRALEVLKTATCNKMSYGLNSGDVRAQNITFTKFGTCSFDVYKDSQKLFSVNLNATGNHNILNSLASICVGLIFNIPNEDIVEGLTKFKNSHKRFELKGNLNDITVIDDYAHHPVEIEATLKAAKNMEANRTLCIFQPHTYTRTKTLFNEFTTCFSNADELILMDIYAAREKDTGLVNSTELGDAIRKTGVKCINVHSHEEALEYLKSIAKPGDLVLTVGAGDVVKVGEMFLSQK